MKLACVCVLLCVFFFFKQKTAYEMRISDWSSDVCSSDLAPRRTPSPRRSPTAARSRARRALPGRIRSDACVAISVPCQSSCVGAHLGANALPATPGRARVRSYKGRHCPRQARRLQRSEEHTSELQSLMPISYAVLCLEKK